MEKTNGNILDRKVAYSHYKISSVIIKISEFVANQNKIIKMNCAFWELFKQSRATSIFPIPATKSKL